MAHFGKVNATEMELWTRNCWKMPVYFLYKVTVFFLR